ncbi:hypothetical protein BWI96_12870 [Siphonobacter sp. SORGH_AS_0500]|uniref:hypothetical protein n=1 Tax=Siphonobacter sp. SORGH_AS_0500 TaxID=1864824 RepID=UPI000CAABA68|nr:hypothetical protein [Siphonobacter sp. SORGH_AS_0500]PKK36279.1 hypothetical protein BWI96_12870 [Siphonobacter sp. SORGH_AS_0500]
MKTPARAGTASAPDAALSRLYLFKTKFLGQTTFTTLQIRSALADVSKPVFAGEKLFSAPYWFVVYRTEA